MCIDVYLPLAISRWLYIVIYEMSSFMNILSKILYVVNIHESIISYILIKLIEDELYLRWI
jgi:hypothetical protein